MREPVRIANCSGFYGDRLAAAREVVDGGPIDVLTGDWLAELTMLILARSARAGRPGYAKSFLAQMEQVMVPCLERGIKVVSNAGGVDPAGCAEAVGSVADELGLEPSIAVVDGDDLTDRLDELVQSGALRDLATQDALREVDRVVSANAYLGCWGVVEALSAGADIVVTGRTTDAALVCGPAAWWHGWDRGDLDRLAGAVVAGHIIECGAQATGGNYSFFGDVTALERIGYPWADVADDGSAVIGKHEGTGGRVSIGTVTSQLLYEIGGPRYLGPDVVARFDMVELHQEGRDRVRVTGAVGEPPPSTLKVAINEIGGYRNDVTVGLTGLDIEAKAAAVEAAFWEAYPVRRDALESVTVRLDRTDKEDPATNAEAVASWHLTVKDPHSDKVGRRFSDAVVELALASVPGFFLLSGPPRGAQPYGVFAAAAIAADLVPQRVTVDGRVVAGSTTAVHDLHLPDEGPDPAAAEPGRASRHRVDGPTQRAPLGAVIGARSGDKGGTANLGVFVRTDRAWPWLDDFLTVDRLRELLPETASLAVARHRLPRLRALNFVLPGLLEEGVAASTRLDPQAKGLGEWLRARIVDVPTILLDQPDAADEAGGGAEPWAVTTR